MPTVTANSFVKRGGGAPPLAVTSAHLEQANTGMVGHDMRKPVSTIVGKGCTQRLVETTLVEEGTLPPDMMDSAVKVAAFLVKYYGSEVGQHQAADAPLDTATVKPRFAVVTVTIDAVTFVLVDIGMRMLEPRELANAQGFPPDYILDPVCWYLTDSGAPEIRPAAQGAPDREDRQLRLPGHGRGSDGGERDAAVIESDGAITVPAALLLGIIREFPEGAQVDLALDGGRLQVNSGRSRYKLQTLPGRDFPLFKDGAGGGGFNVPAVDVVRSLARVSFAQDTDTVVRPYLCGVNVETFEGDLTFVGSDGKRIAWCNLPAPDDVALENAILPTKLVSTLSKLLEGQEGDARLAFGERSLTAQFGDTLLKAKLIDGTYPQWRRIIPTGEGKPLLVKRASLTGAVRRASAVAMERTRAIKLELTTDKLTISARSQSFDEAVEEAPCVWSEADFAFGFNSRFLLDLLNATDADELRVDFYPGETMIQSLALFTNPDDDSARWLLAPMAV
jgi:DNA polymerase III beta subunit